MAKDRRRSKRNKAKNKPISWRAQAQKRLQGMAKYGESKHDSKTFTRQERQKERQAIQDSSPPKDWSRVDVADVLADKNLSQQVWR